MHKIVSFGDSFIFGTELPDNLDGSRAWPGLAAQILGVEYQTCAVPGCGNDRIAQQIYAFFHENSSKDTLAVINWTWTSRLDYPIQQINSWITLGPTCVPDTLSWELDSTYRTKLIDAYRELSHSNLAWNTWRNLTTISAVQRYLEDKGVCCVQTYIDSSMMDDRFEPAPFVLALQQDLSKVLETFEGQTFLEWSRAKQYAVTDPGWHPLSQAHEAACDLWIDRYRKLLKL